MANRYSIFVLLMVALAASARDARAQQGQKPAAAPCPDEQAGKNTDQGASGKNGQKAKSTAAPCEMPAPASNAPASQQFPFPGEPATPIQDGSNPNAPEKPAAPSKPPSAADQYPFPGSAPPMPGSSSSSSSSSSSDGSSSSADDPNDTPAPADSRPPLDDKGDNPRAAVRRKLPKVTKLQSDDERAAEDLDVAKFYEQSGDLNAAYLRARDAVKLQPSDPDAHFVLGHLAQKLNKRDEAIAEYNSYLQLEPDGQKIKQTRKALSQLQ
jgi:tetratricopeptide (TPR) repeat protein